MPMPRSRRTRREAGLPARRTEASDRSFGVVAFPSSFQVGAIISLSSSSGHLCQVRPRQSQSVSVWRR